MLVTGLVVALALIAVRRRHRTPVTLGVVVVVLLVLGAGGIFLIVPPQVPSPTSTDALASCPYDRLVWSNMPEDVDLSWQPCRRVARVQLALTLLGASSVTVMAAAIAVRKPHRPGAVQLGRVGASGR